MGNRKTLASPFRTLAPARQPVASPVDGGRDEVRDALLPWRKLLKSYRWQQLRRKIIERDRFTCQRSGALLYGTHPAANSPVVDHIIPAHVFWWDGRRELFWDWGNLQTLSKAVHDQVKQAEERAGGVGRIFGPGVA